MTVRVGSGAARLFPELGLTCPLLLAGMGGIAGPELVAAVSNAGGSGILGLYKAPPERIAELIAETERATEQVYGVNWVPEVLDEPWLLERVGTALDAARPAVFVSFFGLPPASVARLVRDAGRRLIVQVGSVEEATSAVDMGADALIVQGIEAGGHLLGSEGIRSVLSSTRNRFPELALFAAGGVGSGGDLGTLMEIGADGACCGTIFIPARESRAHPTYKLAILRAGTDDTVISELFEIGWPHRRHRVIRTQRVVAGRTGPPEFVARTRVYGGWLAIPRYSSAVPTVETTGNIEEMAFYCGASCTQVTAELAASDIVREFQRELEHYQSQRHSASDCGPWGVPSWT